jgi:hypothetical protein
MQRPKKKKEDRLLGSGGLTPSNHPDALEPVVLAKVSRLIKEGNRHQPINHMLRGERHHSQNELGKVNGKSDGCGATHWTIGEQRK